MNTTNTMEERHPHAGYLQSQVMSLTGACPFHQSNPHDCPLHEIRKLSAHERLNWVQSLNGTDIDQIIVYHYDCFQRKMDNGDMGSFGITL